MIEIALVVASLVVAAVMTWLNPEMDRVREMKRENDERRAEYERRAKEHMEKYMRDRK